MKVALYARVSTKEQNVDTQLDLMRTHCERTGNEIYEEYIDIGESGKKNSRPEFDRMLKDMRRYRFHAICVYKLDRIGRSLPHLLNLFDEFTKKKVEFISVTQNIDTTTPEGRLFMRMLMLMAEYERELTVDRVKSGMERAKREGKKIGRPKTNINAWEAYRMRQSGMSFRNIADELGVSTGTVQRCVNRVGVKDD